MQILMTDGCLRGSLLDTLDWYSSKKLFDVEDLIVPGMLIL